MKSFTLYRRDFKDHADDGESMFNVVLRDMGFTDDIDEIDTCEVCVADFNSPDGSGLSSGDIYAYRDDGELHATKYPYHGAVVAE